MAKPSMRIKEAATRTVPGELDVGGVWRALVKHRRAIIAPTIVLTAAAAVFVTFATPRYAGEARVLLESRVNYLNRPDRAERDQTNQNAFDSEGVQSQVQVVMSNDLAREAIKRLHLIGNSEFDPSASSFNVIGRIMALLGLSRDLTERSVEDRVMQTYYEKLSVFPVGKSRVVGIEFSSSDPELAARGADVIADLYLDQVAAAKKDLARSAGSWLSSNIDDLRKRVKDAEAKVEDYRGRNGLFASGRDTTLPQQQLAEAATQLSQAKTQQADALAKAQLIREMIRSGRVFEITEVSNNELVRRLIEQRVTLRAQLALEARTLGAAHPRMKELSAQIADVESQIRNAAERTVRGMENDAKVAAARVAQLTASLDEQKKRSAEGAENDVQLRALEREARTLRDQLESYLAKYREAIARDTDNAEPPDARIISRAVVPSRPAFPKKIPIVVLTALASLILCSVIAVARELMGDGGFAGAARSERDDAKVEGEEAAPTTEARADAVEAPTATESASIEAPRESESAAADTSAIVAPPAAATPLAAMNGAQSVKAAHLLLDRLRAEARAGEGLKLAIIGADRADAGDLVAELARSAATSSRAVLVALSGAVAPVGYRHVGLFDLLRGDVSFAEVIHRAQQSPLHVIARGDGDLEELTYDVDATDIVFDALAETYDAIIIDAPFDLSERERAALGRHVDQAAILCRGAQPDEATADQFSAFRAVLGRDPWVVTLDPERQELKTAA